MRSATWVWLDAAPAPSRAGASVCEAEEPAKVIIKAATTQAAERFVFEFVERFISLTEYPGSAKRHSRFEIFCVPARAIRVSEPCCPDRITGPVQITLARTLARTRAACGRLG